MIHQVALLFGIFSSLFVPENHILAEITEKCNICTTMHYYSFMLLFIGGGANIRESELLLAD